MGSMFKLTAGEIPPGYVSYNKTVRFGEAASISLRFRIYLYCP